MSAGVRVSRVIPSVVARRTKSSAVTSLFEPDLESVTELEVDTRVKSFEQIPGPKPLPFLGNTWRFTPVIGEYRVSEIDRLAREWFERFGSLVRVSGLLGRPDMVFLYDADEVARLFRNEDWAPVRPAMPSLHWWKHHLHKDFFSGDDAGLIAVHGESWHSFRTRVQQPMLQPRVARLYTKPIQDTANAFVNRIRELRDENEEMPNDFMNEIHKWSLESIARVALDTRLGCLDADGSQQTQQFINAIKTFFSTVYKLELELPIWKIWPTRAWKDYIAALNTIKDFTTEHINAAMERFTQQGQIRTTEDSSLLERILVATGEPGSYDLKTATVLAIDMFLVGVDTTSSTVASALYQLALHPEKQERLAEEIRQVLPSPDSQIDTQSLDQLHYLRACIREVLRMFPVVVGNGRTLTRDTVIKGFHVPAGTQVVFQHYVISNQERYFTDAARFLPERWLKSGSGGGCPHGRRHPHASLPFGFGKRMCIGRRFAELEIQTLLAKIIHSFQVEYHHKPLEYKVSPLYFPQGALKYRMLDRPF